MNLHFPYHRILISLCIVHCALCIASCRRNYRDTDTTDKKAELKEQMLKTNEAIVHREAAQIEDFINRHGWQMQKTSTGLRYDIYDKGAGKSPGPSSTVMVAYHVYLLNDSLCYMAEESKPLSINLGTGEEVRGLEEGLMLMNEGSHARFVIPNHLGYGITGDGNLIPPASTLYYDVHLIKVIR